jgi:putative PIN family toxin of toxin-antitoxin system
MMLLKVVLDTNLLVAAARSNTGASFAVFQLLRARRFSALVSVPLVLEYEAVLRRPEHLAPGRRTPAVVDEFLDAFCALAQPVHLHYLWRPQLRDPADEMVLEAALNGSADVLVTLNLEDFAPAQQFELPVLSPGAFLHRLRSGET